MGNAVFLDDFLLRCYYLFVLLINTMYYSNHCVCDFLGFWGGGDRNALD